MQQCSQNGDTASRIIREFIPSYINIQKQPEYSLTQCSAQIQRKELKNRAIVFSFFAFFALAASFYLYPKNKEPAAHQAVFNLFESNKMDSLPQQMQEQKRILLYLNF
jgi:hypothetical protein